MPPWLPCHSGRMYLETLMLHCFLVDKRIGIFEVSIINYMGESALERWSFLSPCPMQDLLHLSFLMRLGGRLSFSRAGILKMPVPWSQSLNKTKCISSPSLGRAPRAALMRHLAEEAGRGCLCFNANLTECENQVSAASLLFHMASWLQSAWKGEEERAEMIVELYEGFFSYFF